MSSPTYVGFHHFQRPTVSRASLIILLLSMPLQGCSYRHVIGSTSPPQDYAKADDLLAGHKVRVRLSDGSTLFGAEFVTVGPDSVRFLQGARGRIAIPTERFSSAGYPNRWKGFGWGAVIGGGLGAIIGFASGDDPPSGFFTITAEEKAAALGVAGALVGGISGLIQGFPTAVVRENAR
ncbi:MAG: hypothetical protein BMS9Abin29_1066 [Gemmatimonadota bacterium]|nr:MAG: hypothetical protein BMS9Abin29_1066 [Gemmatimonadota bacterium]